MGARIHEFTLQVSLVGSLADDFDHVEEVHYVPERNGGKSWDSVVHAKIREATEHALGHMNEDLADSGLVFTLKD